MKPTKASIYQKVLADTMREINLIADEIHNLNTKYYYAFDEWLDELSDRELGDIPAVTYNEDSFSLDMGDAALLLEAAVKAMKSGRQHAIRVSNKTNSF